MKFGIIRVPSKQKNNITVLVKGLKVNQSIPLYWRTIQGMSGKTYYEVAIADLKDYQKQICEDLGFQTRLTTLSRKERKKSFKKFKDGKRRNI
jgi:hypothetical protein